MGWSEGRSLGKDGDGRTEPVSFLRYLTYSIVATHDDYKRATIVSKRLKVFLAFAILNKVLHSSREGDYRDIRDNSRRRR